ncbi:hypothetical protein P875_00022190 [Aspergillus parasiticus SU-1]|uniref:Uncharacterized protein n=1 Tax=Aspergillus parasiticus (strain ATCC 56775 / NRRL 5862 / SRRC 143 / SU-1) TaxID=1403190 RepID=A0A0F0IGA5_ASPPU|nr:hypothetical protein P875_00022190 [Aspergillus parasiticus SU-1]
MDALTSPIYIDYNEFFINSSNILTVPYENVTAAFKTPVATHYTAIDGFDWTQPYPGSHRDGHMAYLEISQEMPLSSSIVENATTVLSSLTFGIPNSMSSGGQPLPMDPSWYICRHVFISTKPEAKLAVDGGNKCDFLSQTCQADLKTSLTQDWGKAADGTMCSALGFDAIPPSCQDSFGFARQDVMAFDAAFLANTTLGPVQTNKEQQQYSWRIGTGYHDPGDARASALAANRTYLVATVWGYNQGAKHIQLHRATSRLSIIHHDYDVSIDSFSSNGNGGFIFCEFDAKASLDSYNGYYAGICNGLVVLGRADNNWNELKTIQAADIKAGQKHHLLIQTYEDSTSVYINDLNTPRMVIILRLCQHANYPEFHSITARPMTIFSLISQSRLGWTLAQKAARNPIIRASEVVDDPDFDTVNWAQIGEVAGLEIVSTDFDTIGFRGRMNNTWIFEDWDQKASFETVMSEAKDVAIKAIAKLKADGREPADDRFNTMTAALKTHGDARRYDQVQKITKEFEKKMSKGGSVPRTLIL